jgi:hypothetical protein
MYVDLTNVNSLLRVRDEIAELPYNVYFETKPVKNLKRVRYRIRRAAWLRWKLEHDYDHELKGNEKKLSIAFWNKDKDTLLVIPTHGYLNISDFAKHGTKKEWLALFNQVRKNVRDEEYISTHGHGVAWLHVRIEEKPKHYRWDD